MFHPGVGALWGVSLCFVLSLPSPPSCQTVRWVPTFSRVQSSFLWAFQPRVLLARHSPASVLAPSPLATPTSLRSVCAASMLLLSPLLALSSRH